MRQTDVAGNTSAATSLSFTLDTQVAAPLVSLATDSNLADGITNNGEADLFFNFDRYAAADGAGAELAGIGPVGGLLEVVRLTQQHRGMTAAMLLDALVKAGGFGKATGKFFGVFATLAAIAWLARKRLTEDELRGAVLLAPERESGARPKWKPSAATARKKGAKKGARAKGRQAFEDVDLFDQALSLFDRAAGHRPICVIGTPGTINTGAIDDLNALADLCAREKLWFHVDGAIGAVAILAANVRPQLSGLERAGHVAARGVGLVGGSPPRGAGRCLGSRCSSAPSSPSSSARSRFSPRRCSSSSRRATPSPGC